MTSYLCPQKTFANWKKGVRNLFWVYHVALRLFQGQTF